MDSRAVAGATSARLRARLAIGGYPLVAGGWFIGFVARLGRASLVGAALFLLGIFFTSLRTERRHRLAPRQLRSLAATAGLPAVPVMLIAYASVSILMLAVVVGVIRLLSP